MVVTGEAKNRITIDINITHDNVCRIVKVNNMVYYTDIMSPEMYAFCDDPIKKLECYLLMLKQGKTAYNCRSDCGYLCGFFKKIKFKILGKRKKFKV